MTTEEDNDDVTQTTIRNNYLRAVANKQANTSEFINNGISLDDLTIINYDCYLKLRKALAEAYTKKEFIDAILSQTVLGRTLL